MPIQRGKLLTMPPYRNIYTTDLGPDPTVDNTVIVNSQELIAEDCGRLLLDRKWHIPPIYSTDGDRPLIESYVDIGNVRPGCFGLRGSLLREPRTLGAAVAQPPDVVLDYDLIVSQTAAGLSNYGLFITATADAGLPYLPPNTPDEQDPDTFLAGSYLFLYTSGSSARAAILAASTASFRRLKMVEVPVYTTEVAWSNRMIAEAQSFFRPLRG